MSVIITKDGWGLQIGDLVLDTNGYHHRVAIYPYGQTDVEPVPVNFKLDFSDEFNSQYVGTV